MAFFIILYRRPHRLPCDPAAQRRLAGDAPQTLAGGHVAQSPRKLGIADRHRIPQPLGRPGLDSVREALLHVGPKPPLTLLRLPMRAP
jgi:hypothetical protein